MQSYVSTVMFVLSCIIFHRAISVTNDGKKEMLHLKDHSENKRGNPLPLLYGILFSISSMG